jgi:hypothetical protein
MGIKTPHNFRPEELKNYVINGGMDFDQRFAGAAVSAANTANNAYLIDRYRFYSSQASKFNSGQNQLGFTPPSGFTKYMNFNVVSAYTPLAGDYFCISHTFEGKVLSDLAWGTSAAKTVTVSFWVRSSITGSHGGVMRNWAGNRSYPFLYTISAANTWEYKTVTITGPTDGVWPTDHTGAAQLIFGLGAGSTFSGTAGAWANAGYLSATGAVAVVATNGANWNITGIMMNIGNQAAPFKYFGEDLVGELEACKRYYEKSYDLNTPPGTVSNSNGVDWSFSPVGISNSTYKNVRFAVNKRIAAVSVIPFCPVSGNSSSFRNVSSGITYTASATTISENGFLVNLGPGATVAAGNGVSLHWTADAEIT